MDVGDGLGKSRAGGFIKSVDGLEGDVGTTKGGGRVTHTYGYPCRLWLNVGSRPSARQQKHQVGPTPVEKVGTTSGRGHLQVVGTTSVQSPPNGKCGRRADVGGICICFVYLRPSDVMCRPNADDGPTSVCYLGGSLTSLVV